MCVCVCVCVSVCVCVWKIFLLEQSLVRRLSPFILSFMLPQGKWIAGKFVLYSHNQLYIHICMQKHIQHNKDERTQFFRKIYLSLYWKGCVWEVSWRQNKDYSILTPQLLRLEQCVFFVLLGCSTGGLGAQPLCWELVPTARSGTLTSSS